MSIGGAGYAAGPQSGTLGKEKGEMPDQQQTQPDGMSNNQQQPPQTPPAPPDFDSWLESQPAETQAIIENGTKGLKSALQSERQQRSEMERQLREAAGKAAKGSEDEKRLTEMADRLAAEELRAAFYDEAHTRGVTNLRLAYLAATDGGLIDAKGRVNWDGLSKQCPELFRATGTASGHAGAGTGTAPTGGQSMNDFIRQQAGR